MRIDLNADLGEGFDDAALLPVITSANLACGFHAGDALTMRRVCETAARLGVAVGAQVSYPDREGFGRRPMDPPSDRLSADVLYQLGALTAIAAAAGTSVRYVKPHGALYNTAADDARQAAAIAAAVADAVAADGRPLPLLGLPGSALQSAAEHAGIPFVAEAFADRAYTPQGRLVPRGQPGAVHADPHLAVTQAVSLARAGAASICVHGDTPGAVELARRIREALLAAGFDLAPFAREQS